MHYLLSILSFRFLLKSAIPHPASNLVVATTMVGYLKSWKSKFISFGKFVNKAESKSIIHTHEIRESEIEVLSESATSHFGISARTC